MTAASGSGCRSATALLLQPARSTGCTAPRPIRVWPAARATGRAARSSAAPAASTRWCRARPAGRLRRMGRHRQSGLGLGRRAAWFKRLEQRPWTERMARRRRTAARERCVESGPSAVPLLPAGRCRGRPGAQRRPQRCQCRGRRHLPDHDPRRLARIGQHGLPAAGAAARRADGAQRGAGHADPVLRHAGERRALPHGRPAARGAGAARGHPVGRGDQFAAAAHAVGHRSRRPAAGARPAGGGRPGRGGPEPAGPPVHRPPLPVAGADAEHRARALAGQALGRPALPGGAARTAGAERQPGRRLRALASGPGAAQPAALFFSAELPAGPAGPARTDAPGPLSRLPARRPALQAGQPRPAAAAQRRSAAGAGHHAALAGHRGRPPRRCSTRRCSCAGSPPRRPSAR